MLSNVKMSAGERSMDIAPRNDGLAKVRLIQSDNADVLFYSISLTCTRKRCINFVFTR